jgi:hypothetical protein
MKCPVCNGKKGWTEDLGEGTVLFESCSYCRETGQLGIIEWLWHHIFQSLPEEIQDAICNAKEPK